MRGNFEIKSGTPEEVQQSIDLVKKLFDKLGIPHFFIAGFDTPKGIAVSAKCDATTDALVEMFAGLFASSPHYYAMFKAIIETVEENPALMVKIKTGLTVVKNESRTKQNPE